MSVSARLSTPAGRAAALAVIDLVAESEEQLTDALRRVCGRSVAVGQVAFADLAGVDRGVAVRWSGGLAQLTPHGGVAVVDALLQQLTSLGIGLIQDVPAMTAFPEARSEIEARALSALGVASSPLAVDLLLGQHDAWSGGARDADSESTERDRRLMALLRPPLVVVAGPPNVGKSTLLNALAGRELSLAADEPGTTRDHVGALIDLGGLVVRWADTPGLRDTQGPESEAIALARELIEAADFVIAVGDKSSRDPRALVGKEPDLVVALRSDLGEPGWEFSFAVSVLGGSGVSEFAARVRDEILPPGDLEAGGPWNFWADEA